ncbi:MAG TPA: sigma-70 family RNA polymerase sigma factor [Euzebyales bacterium]|nr:sigma-70 family RNA polymerase sigma factor [Euzebyales bacterium]
MTAATRNRTPAETSDSIADLLARANNGDPVAWGEILRRYGTLVSTTVRSFRLQDADVRDAVQTTWLRLVERIDRVRDPDRLGGWLATTMRRECLSVLRRRSRLVSADALDTVADDGEAPDDALLRDERDHALWRAFRTLDARCQELLRMLMADPPPRYRDVAAALGVTVGYIGPTRMRCLKRLRQALGPAVTG